MRLTRPGGYPAGEHPAPEILERYREGELGCAEARAVAEHVERCAACTMELEQTAEMLRMLSALPQYPAPRSFAVDDLSARRQTRTHNRSLWPAYTSLAASIVLALGFFGSLTGGFGASGGPQYASSARNVVESAPNAGGLAEDAGAAAGAAVDPQTGTSAAADTLVATEAPAGTGAGAAATIAPEFGIANAPEAGVTAAAASVESAPRPGAGDTAAATPSRPARTSAKAPSPGKARTGVRASRTAVAAAAGGAGASPSTRVPRGGMDEASARRHSSPTQAPAADEEQGAIPADSPFPATVAADSAVLRAPTPAATDDSEGAVPGRPTTEAHPTEANDAPTEESAPGSSPLTDVLGALSLASLVLAVALFLRARMLG